MQHHRIRQLLFSTQFLQAFDQGRLLFGANLRGIGVSSTLVLLNGRRIAPYGIGFTGLKKDEDVVDVIAYIQEASTK